MSVFENFKLLKMDMIEKGWIIDAFPFKFKNHDYIVLAKLYEEGEKKPQYALMKVEILKRYNIDERLIAPVNVNGFLVDAKLLREFFNIEYGENLGNLLSQFNEYFSKFIPAQMNLVKPQELEQAMILSLSKSDSQDPNKLYCYAVKRNPEGQKRTPFNDNKTRLLRPNLYSEFESDSSISFCYSTDVNDAKIDAEIIAGFTNR
ncbi:hypothetical protein D0C16_10255 [Cellvibrio sp. KY-GH-1]|uniref:DUF6037 family protein n=1 Tax=Cellvibrio sp. KY-GH-1 TaxID=2303332 RepID=UPI001248E94B|nr:DUF6037 family protein [Cellvibrio sp. KY-GH-1]QEY16329.1 hypothetical protein D0C16_10255 [Cellvibrio sp. KY-GH-1]